jgi:hypothetical protein
MCDHGYFTRGVNQTWTCVPCTFVSSGQQGIDAGGTYTTWIEEDAYGERACVGEYGDTGDWVLAALLVVILLGCLAWHRYTRGSGDKRHLHMAFLMLSMYAVVVQWLGYEYPQSVSAINYSVHQHTAWQQNLMYFMCWAVGLVIASFSTDMDQATLGIVGQLVLVAIMYGKCVHARIPLTDSSDEDAHVTVRVQFASMPLLWTYVACTLSFLLFRWCTVTPPPPPVPAAPAELFSLDARLDSSGDLADRTSLAESADEETSLV